MSSTKPEAHNTWHYHQRQAKPQPQVTYRKFHEVWTYGFWVIVTSNGSPYAYATGPLPCLSVMLVYCDQTVGWIKMPLGMEVGLGPGHIVLDSNPAPPTERGTAAPTFRPMSVVAKGSTISATAELVEIFKQTDTHTKPTVSKHRRQHNTNNDDINKSSAIADKADHCVCLLLADRQHLYIL